MKRTAVEFTVFDDFDDTHILFQEIWLIADDPFVGGEKIPIESTSLILAGAQSFSWMIPVVLSVLGIGIAIFSRKDQKN